MSARGHEEKARAVVFDLDGTLVDSHQIAAQAYVDTLGRLGARVTTEQILSTWHGCTTEQLLTGHLGRACIPSDLAVHQAVVRDGLGAVTVFPGVTALLDRLVERGFLLGVLTGASRVAADLVLHANGLDGYFRVVVCGDEIAEPKPSPAGLLETCLMLGVDAAHTAYVGDAETDMECAARAGSRGILTTWGRPGASRSAEDAPLTADKPESLLALLDGRPDDPNPEPTPQGNRTTEATS